MCKHHNGGGKKSRRQICVLSESVQSECDVHTLLSSLLIARENFLSHSIPTICRVELITRGEKTQ